MVAVSEVFKAWQEGLANKDSSKIGEFFADDFVFIRPTSSVDLRGGTRTRQETLDWTAAGGSPTTISVVGIIMHRSPTLKQPVT